MRHAARWWMGSFLALALATPACSQSPGSVDLTWGAKIPMRDGIKLNATVYRPKGMKEPTPVIFTLTPYVSDTYHDRAMFFSQHGYVFVIVDVRGRGNSEGTFEPMRHDGVDGFDTVEWLAEQPWCNGKVAMWGGSYAGFNQWATLKEFPPHLVTIVPAASAYPGIDFPAPGGIFMPYMMRWLTFTSGRALNEKLFREASFWIDKFRHRYLNHIPFHTLDEVVGNPSPHFQKWLQHRGPDDYWNAVVPSAEHYARITQPILTITGHYDADQAGAMAFYHRHMKHGSSKAKDQHYLIVGPWDHAGTRTPSEEVGGLKFSKSSLVDMNILHLAWYNWTMKKGPKPSILEKRVLYFVPGAEVWKNAASLDDIPTRPLKLYLAAENGMANDVFRSGRLTREPAKCPPARYTYDPLDVRPAEIEKEEVKESLIDQRYVMNLFGNGLIYHSEPFSEPTEITGYLRFVASICLNVPDTDFQVSVYEIMPDGKSIYLTSDSLRARYRTSLTKETLVKPGTVERYEFTSFRFFARQLQKGSRLRLFFSCPNSITMEKNYNSGGDVARETAKDARTAHITVYQDAEHPSFLEAPIVQRKSESMEKKK